MGQSTNDMFPTAIHVAVAVGIRKQLVPALKRLARRAGRQGKGLGQDHQDRPHAPGRRHAAAAGTGDRRIRPAARALGRAGRAGLARPCWNCQPAARRSAPASTRIRNSAAESPRPWRKKPAFPSSKRPTTSRATRSATGSSNATANCGPSRPRCSTSPTIFAGSARGRAAASYEVKLPDRQPGSSIMPGKVNPVMCESMMQVAARVMGNDQTIAISGATGGQFQLNIMMPVMGAVTLESVRLLGQILPTPSSISASTRWKPTPKPAKRRSKRACRW